MFDIVDLSHLKKTLNLFEKNTDALVIDITHNPGGEVLKAFAVISYLITEPIANYENTEILTSEEVDYAVTFKYFLEGAEDEKELQSILKKMSCYNPGPILGQQFLSYANFLIESWENGNRMTSLFPINGIDMIYPDKTCHYTKPILLLTDHLSISCADFFPGILQDSGRAEVMGQRTAGAGGFVFPAISFPNQLGIDKILITNSMIFRTNGVMLENLGIEPLNPYEYTLEDIQNDYRPYKEAINQKIDSMIYENN